MFLQECYGQHDFIATYQTCLVKSKNKWERGVIVSVDEANKEAVCLLADIIEERTISFEDIRLFPVTLNKYYLQCLEITLDRLQPSPHLRTSDLTRAMKEAIEGQLLYVKIVKRPKSSNEPIEAELYTKVNCQVLAYQALVDTKIYKKK